MRYVCHQHVQHVICELGRDQQVTFTRQIHHCKLSEHHANMRFALVIAGRIALASLTRLDGLDEEPEHFL